ncbi:MAG: ATP-binding cassette domain-containing protein [Acidobacteriota bacterium]
MSILEASGIHFRHSASGRWILRGLSLQLESETAIIIGDNGSGKSTLGRLIAGLSKAETGRVEIDGREVTSINVSARPGHVVYMGQTSYLQFFRSSIQDEIRFAARLVGRSEAETEVAYANFSLPEDRSLKPMDLAYPAMWRLQLFLLAVVFSPSVLFVDEIVAPGARAQIDALTAVIDERSRKRQVTILAYQRMLPIDGIRRFDLRDGQLFG